MADNHYKVAFWRIETRNTRSAGKDTDYASLAVSTPLGVAGPIHTSMGDVNNGFFEPGLVFPHIILPDDGNLRIAWSVMNSVHDKWDIVQRGVDAGLKYGVSVAGDSANPWSELVGAVLEAFRAVRLPPVFFWLRWAGCGREFSSYRS